MSRKLLTMDGNMAAAYVSYAYTEVAAIYPITPSSPMADYTSVWAVKGRKNIFGEPVRLVQLQSEAGAAGAFHGMLNAGALSSTYTSSQGLLLMIPNMYKVAGELLPGVINVAARTVATHALSIFGDHQDVYACRQTGFAMLSTGSVQEVMDLTPVAHLVAIESRIPFLNFFDGFRTSHEIQKIYAWDYDKLKSFCNMEAVKAFKARSLNPERPQMRGSAQNPDVFFQIRESSNIYYNNLPDIVEKYMNMINESIGTDYGLFNYYGDKEAENVIIAMGSVCDTIEETIDIIQSNNIDITGNYNKAENSISNNSNVKNITKKVGLIRVHLYRPFSKKHLLKALPKTVKVINVLDRTKESGAVAEPLCEDVITALKGTEFENVKVLGGRYGLSSKNTTPADIVAVFNNESKNNFTVGINDDVTHLSLKVEKNLQDNSGVEQIEALQQGSIELDCGNKDIISCKFWGMGADGTVGANKNTIKIIGDYTDLQVQAYFEYDSKKSGGLTISHLRFGKTRIKSAYLIEKADFVACHVQSYLDKYDLIRQVNKNGKFLINCEWNDEEIVKKLKKSDIEYILNNNIKLYAIDGYKIANEIGLGNRTGTIMQAVFFKVANIIPSDKAIEYMKQMVKKTYSSKGERIVNMNYDSIDRAILEVREVDISSKYKELEGSTLVDKNSKQSDCYNEKGVINDRTGFCDKCSFAENIQQPINVCKGDELPVSAFLNMADGTLPVGTSAFEKRGVANYVPVWNFDGCIQCNMCSYVCPHAVIRPVVLNEATVKNAPNGMKYTKMVGEKDKYFAITISSYDCTGCALCANVCPGNMKNNVLSMKKFNNNIVLKDLSKVYDTLNEETQNNNKIDEFSKLDETIRQQKYFDYAMKVNENDKVWEHFKRNTVKGSQFFTPLLEFSGACAGCGETAYAKLVTQLFGERMIVANATGCSSIWGGSMPSIPYTTNKDKKGVAWSNSLFEDAAEYGYGMLLASESNRNNVFNKLCKLILHFRENNLEYKENAFGCNSNDGMIKNNCEKLDNSKEVQLDNQALQSDKVSKGVKKNSEARQQDFIKDIRTQLVELVEAYKKYYEDGRINCKLADKIIAKLVEYKSISNKENELKLIDDILNNKEFLSKKSHWVFGGDGWAYDIGFSGLDHVLSTKADINILVFDTEVYSNTGGQASKATNLGAIAQFASNGKSVKKKSLADMMMTYGYVYVAQVSLGADMNQCVKAIDEAEKYNGPSIVIAYAPCINHGIEGGMTKCVDEQKKAVQAGYWNIFRYNPEKKLSGEIPFILDSKPPVMEYTDFLMGENRYVNLKRQDKQRADRLFEEATNDAKERYERYKKMAGK